MSITTLPLYAAPLYAALCGLLLLVLSVRVVLLRNKYKVGIGDGGHGELNRAVRVQANFVEYVPLTLLLLALLELAGAPALALHGLGAALVLSRLAHAIGYSQSAGASAGRAAGVLLTFLVLLIASAWLLYLAIT
ncbi:MAPEG family protein [Ferrovibrio sp.]|uniref:MAPEG family protein n=1 Tax=Ferrovibrio sp. TaxID=1917215 RepID=UPI0025C5F02C|nr:MAPEG family protein [Ferrovibrio sp.]MBX3453536.1 MAPEG family protein [Ferrovibrio sp.]